MFFKRKSKPPLCKCGCGEYVSWNKRKKKWNDILIGHYIRTKEIKTKLSNSAKKRGFFKEYNKTEEHRLKVIQSNKNRKLSEETKQKISNSLKGFKHSEETKQKMKETHRKIAKVGKESPNWKGGKRGYGERWSSTFSPDTKERDRKCIYCGAIKNLQTHHIDFNKKNNDPYNLITLCRKHHTNLHPRKNFLKNDSLEINNKRAEKIQKQITKYIKNLKKVKKKIQKSLN